MASQNKYQAYKKQDTRRFKPEIAITVFVLLVVSAIGGVVVFDQLRNPSEINNENNSATLGYFESNLSAFKDVDNDLFTLSIPEGWVEVNSPELLDDGARYYPARYQGVTGEDVGRWLDVYTDQVPNIAVDRVVKIESAGSGVSFIGASPLCTTLEDNLNKERTSFQPTVWEGVEFLCRMSTIGNTVAATDVSVEDGIQLNGNEGGARNLLFVYGDHGSAQNNSIFEKILSSFRLK